MFAQNLDHPVPLARQQQVKDFPMFGMRVRIDCVLFLPVHARHGDNQ